MVNPGVMLWYLDCLTRGLLESETELHELSAEFVFVVPVSSTLGFSLLPLCWVSTTLSFHSMSFLLCLASAWWGPSQGCFSQVTSRSWDSKDLKWWTSVTAWLQVRVLFKKQRTVYPRCVRVGWPPKESMQSTSYKMLGWMNHQLESRLPGEISTTSDKPMITL